jgi:hypothetical protein
MSRCRRCGLTPTFLVLPVILLGLLGLAAVAAPSDRAEDEIDALLDRLYAAISGPVGADRDWEAFHACFATGARMGAFFRTPEGAYGSFEMTPTQYQERIGPELVRLGFTEREVSRELDIFGTVAHAFSTYRGEAQAEPPRTVEGINSVQMVRTSNGWRVYSLVWQQASEELPVPEVYRPESD